MTEGQPGFVMTSKIMRSSHGCFVSHAICECAEKAPSLEGEGGTEAQNEIEAQLSIESA